MICDFHAPNFTHASPVSALANAQPATPLHSCYRRETTEKQPSSRNATRSTGARAITAVADFHVNGCDVLLPLVSDDLVDFACTHRMARLARGHGGFITSCSGPLTRVQITLTDVLDPLAANRSLLHAREQLMRIAEAIPSTGAIRCRNIETYVSDLTRDTPLLAVHLLFEGREEIVAHAIHECSSELFAALEKISGGNAHVQLPTRCTSKRLVQADVRLATSALVCGRYGGKRIGEHVVQLHQLNSAVPSRTRDHNAAILQSIAPAMAAVGNDWGTLVIGAHAWAARHGRCTSLAHWALDTQGYLQGTLMMPVPIQLGCGLCPANHCTDGLHRTPSFADADDLHGSTEVLAAVALAQSLATLRTQAIEDLQCRFRSPSAAVIDIADFSKATGMFTHTGTKG